MIFARSLKQIARRVIVKTANILDIPRIRLSKANHGIILAYHSIETQRSGYTYGVSKENFKKHMEFLADNVELVSLEKIFNSKGDSFRIAVTFDDAYEDFYTNALPILNRRSIPAAVFVPTLFVDENKRILEEKERGCYKKHLNWDQMRQVQSEYVRFESHSHCHISAVKLAKRDFKADLEKSVYLLEKNLGRAPKYFSYPGGSHNAETDKTALSYGFERLLSLEGDYVRGKSCEGRLSILKGNEDIDFFKCKAAGITISLRSLTSLSKSPHRACFY